MSTKIFAVIAGDFMVFAPWWFAGEQNADPIDRPGCSVPLGLYPWESILTDSSNYRSGLFSIRPKVYWTKVQFTISDFVPYFEVAVHP